MDLKNSQKLSREKSTPALPSTSQSNRYPGQTASIFTQSASTLTRGVIKWSFPKAKRFKEKPNSTRDVPLLNLGSTLSKSSTSLGFGKRYQFRPIETPGPYLSHREIPKTKKKYLPDANSDSVSIFKNLIPCTRESWDIHKEIPGPGSYEISREFVKNNKGVKIKSRLNMINPIKENPGPNYYLPKAHSVEKNRYSAIVFGTSRRSDFTKLVIAKNPGPGAYEMNSVFDRKIKKHRNKDQEVIRISHFEIRDL